MPSALLTGRRQVKASGDAARVERRGAGLVEPHVPRVPRVTLEQGTLTADAVAFALGEIDRAELMRRISR
jgi:hypothetical protein